MKLNGKRQWNLSKTHKTGCDERFPWRGLLSACQWFPAQVSHLFAYTAFQWHIQYRTFLMWSHCLIYTVLRFQRGDILSIYKTWPLAHLAFLEVMKSPDDEKRWLCYFSGHFQCISVSWALNVFWVLEQITCKRLTRGMWSVCFKQQQQQKNQHAVLSTVTCPIIHSETEHSFGTHCNQNGSGADLMIPNWNKDFASAVVVTAVDLWLGSTIHFLVCINSLLCQVLCFSHG